MKHRDNNKMDKVLTHFFREEARMIKLPNQERCWQDFQQRLDKVMHQETSKGISPFTGNAPKKSSRYSYFLRYRNLTALAAACFIVIILLSGMPPVQSLRQVLTGSRASTPAQEESLKMSSPDETGEELQIQTFNRQPEIAANDQAGSAKSPSPARERGNEYIPMSMPAQEEAEEDISMFSSPETAPPGAGEMEVFTAEATVLREELSFNTLEEYGTALAEHKELARGQYYYLAAPPEGYNFSNAQIVKADNIVRSVRQEFCGSAGDMLIIQQIFPETVTSPPAENQESTEEQRGAATPGEQVYGYGGPGYQVSMQNDLNTIQLVQENTVIMITGRLEEADLMDISHRLITLEQRY